MAGIFAGSLIPLPLSQALFSLIVNFARGLPMGG
jgi:hypothetical protein